MIILDDETDEENYEHINRNILDGNVMNMSVIITEWKYGDVDADYSSYHGYYIIKILLSTYTLQVELSIDGQVISSGEMVCGGTYFFPININYHYYYLQITISINTLVSLRTIINGNVNLICYYSKDFIPLFLWSI